jgi:uncharacterized lipoprotein NlpE involved in copper resistance
MKATILTAMIATLVLTGCGDSKEVKAQKAAEIAAQKAEDQRRGFHCLSSWDGSHRATVNYIKENLRDPDSYQHIKTSITPADKEGNHILIMQYRAKNGFGGYVPGSVMVTVKNEDCSGKLIGTM